jgi:DNA gyrase subunit B
MPEYKSSDIVVLDGLEAVRRRPGMYMGDVHDGTGLHHMLFEVLGNAIDEHLAGRASTVLVRIRGDEVTIADDGGGIRCALSRSGKSLLHDCVARLHGSATQDHHFPHVHIGSSLNGVGIAAVNALSAEFEIETHHRGRGHRITCRQGKVHDEREQGESQLKGTTVCFRPDPTIFSSVRWDIPALRKRLRELASLNPALTFRFEHESVETIRAPGGLVDLLRHLEAEEPVVEPLRLVGAHDDVIVEVALMWRKSGKPQVQGFVSQFAATEGTHVQGFWDGLCDGWVKNDCDAEVASNAALRELLGEGLVAAVHVALYDPRFGAPTRNRLASPEGRRAVYAVMRRGFDHIFNVREHAATQLLKSRTRLFASED